MSRSNRMSSAAVAEKGFAFAPTADRVLVRVKGPETMTPGGIALPETSEKKPHQGVVVATGPDVKDERVREDSLVLFGQYAGLPIPGHADLLIMKEEDILAVQV